MLGCQAGRHIPASWPAGAARAVRQRRRHGQRRVDGGTQTSAAPGRVLAARAAARPEGDPSMRRSLGAVNPFGVLLAAAR
jgi:hypothetical protein